MTKPETTPASTDKNSQFGSLDEPGVAAADGVWFGSHGRGSGFPHSPSFPRNDVSGNVKNWLERGFIPDRWF
jgi:hypothetical protein